MFPTCCASVSIVRRSASIVTSPVATPWLNDGSSEALHGAHTIAESRRGVADGATQIYLSVPVGLSSVYPPSHHESGKWMRWTLGWVRLISPTLPSSHTHAVVSLCHRQPTPPSSRMECRPCHSHRPSRTLPSLRTRGRRWDTSPPSLDPRPSKLWRRDQQIRAAMLLLEV